MGEGKREGGRERKRVRKMIEREREGEGEGEGEREEEREEEREGERERVGEKKGGGGRARERWTNRRRPSRNVRSQRSTNRWTETGHHHISLSWHIIIVIAFEKPPEKSRPSKQPRRPRRARRDHQPLRQRPLPAVRHPPPPPARVRLHPRHRPQPPQPPLRPRLPPPSPTPRPTPRTVAPPPAVAPPSPSISPWPVPPPSGFPCPPSTRHRAHSSRCKQRATRRRRHPAPRRPSGRVTPTRRHGAAGHRRSGTPRGGRADHRG